MPLWSDLHSTGFPLIQRIWLHTPGLHNLTAPASTAWVRASAGGAGGFKDDSNGWGGGAAFAFQGEACAAAAAFTAQVGDSAYCRPSANTVLGDSWVKRANSSLLVSADRGRPDGTGGLVANCTGAVKRAGSDATANAGGASAGDDADDVALGFGGRGASQVPGVYDALSAWYGGGGGFVSARPFLKLIAAGDGLICVEFFAANPGY